MERAAIKAAAAVNGIRRPMPPISASSRVPDLVIDAAHHHEKGGLIEGVNQKKSDGRRQGRCRAPAQKHGDNAQRHDRGVGQNTFQVGLAIATTAPHNAVTAPTTTNVVIQAVVPPMTGCSRARR